MNIEVSKQEVILNHQCIACHRCTSEAACPIKDTVTISTKKDNAAFSIKKEGAVRES